MYENNSAVDSIDESLTWPLFVSKVGHSAWLKNPRETEYLFQSRYQYKGVSWDGYVVRVLTDDVNYNHAATILVKMAETDYD